MADVSQQDHDDELLRYFRLAKTLGRLDNYHWKHKTREAQRYFDGCATCQEQKDHGGQVLNDLASLKIPQRRQGILATDLITQLLKTERDFDAITT